MLVLWLPRRSPVYHRTRTRPEVETSWSKEDTTPLKKAEYDSEEKAHEAEPEASETAQAVLNQIAL